MIKLKKQYRSPKNHPASIQMVKDWLQEGLNDSDPRPPDCVLEKLIRKLQSIVNRQNNAELERRGPVPSTELKDVSPSDELERRARKIVDAAYKIAEAVHAGLAVVNELEGFVGGYEWNHAGRKTSLQDVREIFESIQAKLWSIRGLAAPSRARPNRRGRPGAPWHEAGRQFGGAFQAAMRAARYKGRLAMTSEESITAFVGAKAISWAYGITIRPKGFASAMTKRNRGKKSANDFYERFPGAARIKILE